MGKAAHRPGSRLLVLMMSCRVPYKIFENSWQSAGNRAIALPHGSKRVKQRTTHNALYIDVEYVLLQAWQQQWWWTHIYSHFSRVHRVRPEESEKNHHSCYLQPKEKNEASIRVNNGHMTNARGANRQANRLTTSVFAKRTLRHAKPRKSTGQKANKKQ